MLMRINELEEAQQSFRGHIDVKFGYFCMQNFEILTQIQLKLVKSAPKIGK